jgi:type IV pilus assembly protein PilM
MLRVLLVAAARDMVDSALAAVQKAGLQPSMVDLTSFAVLRSLYQPERSVAVEARRLVDIGASVTNIVIHQAACRASCASC